MMFVPTTAVAVAAACAQVVSGHFSIEYPKWRADTIALENETLGISQWNYPCGGIGDEAGNRTDWPLGGGPVAVKLHHPWTYIYINAGVSIGGVNVTDFNMSLTPDLHNVTGKGWFCLPDLKLPSDLADGTRGSLQIVTNGRDGQDMYNCADITFRADAKVPDGICKNDSDITATIVGQSNGGMNMTMPMATVTQAGSTSTAKPNSANGATEAFGMTLAVVVSLFCVAFTGLGF
ncbi:hypothetical protein GGR53DRAFT_464723 [Hypoxylon sp. FL1150]|nr:hypothetical protein GGR53DRAFT_464723 [Hypoxylon sp. FL1150]